MTVRHPSPNRYLLVGVAALALALAACGGDQDTTDQTTTPTSTTAETTTETTSSTTPTTPPDTTEAATPVEPEPAPVEEAPAEQPEAVEPESIWAPPGQGYQCPRTDAFVWDPANCTPDNLGAGPAPDLSNIPVWQGGECSYAECGYPGEPAPIPPGGDPSTWDYEGPRNENGDPLDHPQLNWPE